MTANERCLLSGSEDGNVHMWDIASGQLVRTIFETKGLPANGCLSPALRLPEGGVIQELVPQLVAWRA